MIAYRLHHWWTHMMPVQRLVFAICVAIIVAGITSTCFGG